MSVNKFLLVSQSQPKEEVNAPGGSGTKVTWSGLISITFLTKKSDGYPSTLNSLFSNFDNKFFKGSRSENFACLSSGRGCTVIPSAP